MSVRILSEKVVLSIPLVVFHILDDQRRWELYRRAMFAPTVESRCVVFSMTIEAYNQVLGLLAFALECEPSEAYATSANLIASEFEKEQIWAPHYHNGRKGGGN